MADKYIVEYEHWLAEHPVPPMVREEELAPAQIQCAVQGHEWETLVDAHTHLPVRIICTGCSKQYAVCQPHQVGQADLSQAGDGMGIVVQNRMHGDD